MDRVFNCFLMRQAEEGLALARESDLFSLDVLPSPRPPRRFLASFRCSTFVQTTEGQIIKAAPTCVVGIRFPERYLMEANTFEVCTWLFPSNVFHPNILTPAGNHADRPAAPTGLCPGAICVGERFLRPGTPLVELIYQLYSIVSWQKWASANGLNREACQWARNNQHLFPADPRPLKRRKIEFQISTVRS